MNWMLCCPLCLSFRKNFVPVCTIFINLGWQYVKSHKATYSIRPEDDRLTVETCGLIEINIVPSKADKKLWRRWQFDSSVLWCHVRNEEVLLRVNEQRNILHEIRKRKANWIGHILRRNCLLKQVIEGKIKGEIEVTRRRGRRRKKLLDDRRGYSHLKV